MTVKHAWHVVNGKKKSTAADYIEVRFGHDVIFISYVWVEVRVISRLLIIIHHVSGITAVTHFSHISITVTLLHHKTFITATSLTGNNVINWSVCTALIQRLTLGQRCAPARPSVGYARPRNSPSKTGRAVGPESMGQAESGQNL